MIKVSKIRYRYDWLKTKVLRKILPERNADQKALRDIKKKVKRLGSRYEDGNSNCRGYTYHPIVFDDFSQVSYHRDVSGCEERFRAILEDIHIKPGDRVLDVGANVGYFAFSLAKHGAIVDAVELQTDSFEIGASLAKMYNMDVCYLNKPISRQLLAHLDNQYKCVLLLSVIHWVMKQCGREETIELLREIARYSDTIFFEVPSTPEDGMVTHEDFLSIGGVKEFLAEAFPEFTVEELLTGTNWRKRVLFKITCS